MTLGDAAASLACQERNAAEIIRTAEEREAQKRPLAAVEAFSTSPEEWLNTVGRNAHARWKEWLDERRDRLVWNPETRAFVERRS